MCVRSLNHDATLLPASHQVSWSKMDLFFSSFSYVYIQFNEFDLTSAALVSAGKSLSWC